MKSVFFGTLMVVLMSGFFIEARATPNFQGTWNFKMTVMQNTCETTPASSFSLTVTQTGKSLSAVYTQVVGVGREFLGYVGKGGASMVVKSECVIVPGGTCSPDVNSLAIFTENESAKPSRVNAVSVYHHRGSDNGYLCSVLMKGTATKKNNKK